MESFNEFLSSFKNSYRFSAEFAVWQRIHKTVDCATCVKDYFRLSLALEWPPSPNAGGPPLPDNSFVDGSPSPGAAAIVPVYSGTGIEP
jgi:hypothetical protein